MYFFKLYDNMFYPKKNKQTNKQTVIRRQEMHMMWPGLELKRHVKEENEKQRQKKGNWKRGLRRKEITKGFNTVTVK